MKLILIYTDKTIWKQIISIWLKYTIRIGMRMYVSIRMIHIFVHLNCIQNHLKIVFLYEYCSNERMISVYKCCDKTIQKIWDFSYTKTFVWLQNSLPEGWIYLSGAIYGDNRYACIVKTVLLGFFIIVSLITDTREVAWVKNQLNTIISCTNVQKKNRLINLGLVRELL